MPKELRCGDVIPGCDAVIRGDTEDDVLRKGAAHAKEVHDIDEIPPDVAAKVKAAIRSS